MAETTFEDDLKQVLEKHRMDAVANIPSGLLSEFLSKIIDAIAVADRRYDIFNKVVMKSYSQMYKKFDKWLGKPSR